MHYIILMVYTLNILVVYALHYINGVHTKYISVYTLHYLNGVHTEYVSVYTLHMLVVYT